MLYDDDDDDYDDDDLNAIEEEAQKESRLTKRTTRALGGERPPHTRHSWRWLKLHAL